MTNLRRLAASLFILAGTASGFMYVRPVKRPFLTIRSQAGEEGSVPGPSPELPVQPSAPEAEKPSESNVAGAFPLAYIFSGVPSLLFLARDSFPISLLVTESGMTLPASLPLQCAVGSLFLHTFLPVAAALKVVHGAARVGLPRLQSETYQRLNLALTWAFLLFFNRWVWTAVHDAAGRFSAACVAATYFGLTMVCARVFIASQVDDKQPGEQATELLTSSLWALFFADIAKFFSAIRSGSTKVSQAFSDLLPRFRLQTLYRFTTIFFTARVFLRAIASAVAASAPTVGAQIGMSHLTGAGTDLMKAATCYSLWDASKRGRLDASTFLFQRKVLRLTGVAGLVLWAYIGTDARVAAMFPVTFLVSAILANIAMVLGGVRLLTKV